MARTKRTAHRVKPFDPEIILEPLPKARGRRGRPRRGEEYRARWQARYDEIVREKTREAEAQLEKRRQAKSQLMQQAMASMSQSQHLMGSESSSSPVRVKKRKSSNQPSYSDSESDDDSDTTSDSEDERAIVSGKKVNTNQFSHDRIDCDEESSESESADSFKSFDRSEHVTEDEQNSSAGGGIEEASSTKNDEEWSSSEPDILLVRFGTARYVEDVINNIELYDAKETFRVLEATKARPDERYEAARQQFLKLLGQHRAKWHATSRSTDSRVEITKLHQEDEGDYIAFMRIRPGGFRGERQVPEYMRLTFHLLIGRVIFFNRRRPRNMARGSHTIIQPRSNFSIKCASDDQPAVFVFKITLNRPYPGETSRSQLGELVLDNAQSNK